MYPSFQIRRKRRLLLGLPRSYEKNLTKISLLTTEWRLFIPPFHGNCYGAFWDEELSEVCRWV